MPFPRALTSTSSLGLINSTNRTITELRRSKKQCSPPFPSLFSSPAIVYGPSWYGQGHLSLYLQLVQLVLLNLLSTPPGSIPVWSLHLDDKKIFSMNQIWFDWSVSLRLLGLNIQDVFLYVQDVLEKWFWVKNQCETLCGQR